MRIDRLFQFARRHHPLLLPGLLMLFMAMVFALVWSTGDGGVVRADMSDPQVLGTCLMFVLMPAYLLGMLLFQSRTTDVALLALAPVAPWESVQRVRRQMDQMIFAAPFAILGGGLFGAVQNYQVFINLWQTGITFPMDLAFAFGNSLLWSFVALLLCWRIPVSRRLSELGRVLPVDLYRLQTIKPLARVATTDVLVIAGAMAFMPLQSLDAEFRYWNYQWGIIVGLSAAIVLFLLPLWGVRESIRRRKAERLGELSAALATCDTQDFAQLETLSAHAERIRGLPDWPLDIQLLTRIVAYVIIPPLAWIAAALVENLVDQL